MVIAHAGWFLWPLIPLAWFTFFFLIFVFLVRSRRRRWWDGTRSGESVLAERFARGEIDEAEYRGRRAVLREGGEK
jgi:putative membrane protein